VTVYSGDNSLPSNDVQAKPAGVDVRSEFKAEFISPLVFVRSVQRAIKYYYEIQNIQNISDSACSV
jgi:hypothetical protein